MSLSLTGNVSGDGDEGTNEGRKEGRRGRKRAYREIESWVSGERPSASARVCPATVGDRLLSYAPSLPL